MTTKFETRPATVEVLNYSGGNPEEVEAFVGKTRDKKAAEQGAFFVAFDGYDLWATAGEWIVKTEDGRFHACNPLLFEAIFKPA